MSVLVERGAALTRHSTRLAGFALLPALSMLAPLVLLPLVSVRFGPDGWGSLAIGQSVGAVLSFVLGMVWPITGGHRIAGADDPAERRRVFLLSMATRACLLLLLLPLGTVVTVLLAPGYKPEAAIFAAAVTLNGFTAAWYFAGIGRPRAVVVNEGVLRFAGYGLAVAGLLAGAGLWWYATAMLLVGFAMPLANAASVLRGHPRPRFGWPDVRRELREQARPTASRGLQSLFYYGGVTVVALVAPPVLALFAAADQVQKAANNGLAILPTAFIGWVGGARGPEIRRNGLRAFAAVGGLALVAVLLWVLLADRLVGLLFAGQVSLELPVVLLVGAVILVFVLSRSAELLLLVPVGLEGAVWRSNRIASPVGLAAIAAGAVTAGLPGALLGTLVTELGSFVYYLATLRRHPGDAVPVP